MSRFDNTQPDNLRSCMLVVWTKPGIMLWSALMIANGSLMRSTQ